MINYQPKIRVTPLAGPQVIYDLTTITHLTRSAVFWEPVYIEKEMLDYSIKDLQQGYRVRAELEFVIPQAPHADMITLADILEKISDPNALVEISMGNDALGNVLYREIGRCESTPEYVENVMQIVHWTWILTCRELVVRPEAPGAGGTARW